MDRAVLYVPAGTTRVTGDRIALAALQHCHTHDLVLVALAWTMASAAAIVAGDWADLVIAARASAALERAVAAAGGRVVTLSPAPQRARGGLDGALAAMVASGRLAPDVADELRRATGEAGRRPDPHRRAVRQSA